jgi:hypothetical protein
MIQSTLADPEKLAFMLFVDIGIYYMWLMLMSEGNLSASRSNLFCSDQSLWRMRCIQACDLAAGQF